MHLVEYSSCSWEPRSEETLRHPNDPPAGTTCPSPFNDPTNSPTATARLSRQLVLIGARYALFPVSLVLALGFFFFSFSLLPSCSLSLVSDRENSTGPEVVFLADGDRLKVRATLVSTTSHVPVTY